MSPHYTARRLDWALLAILLVALAFRLYRIDTPYVDAHSWRQITNADIARNWTDGPIQFAKPLVSWGGADGRVGLEFPLLHLLTAWAWRITGPSDTVGRLVPVAFSTASVMLLYLLGARLFGRPAGLAAASLLAVSPSVVYFGRTLLSDTPMIFFSIAAVLGYVAYAQSGRARHALLGSIALALAGLVKIPAILVLGPALWTGIVTRRWAILKDPWYVVAPFGALCAVGLWYLHADLLYQSTGLTQAIFRPSGTYAGDIAAWSGPFSTVSHWTRSDLISWATLRELGLRYFRLHLTPIGSVITVAGFLFAWRPLARRSVVDVWMLAALSLVLVSLSGQLPHEFHQLPTLPPLALYFGLGAAPLFDGERWARLGRFRAATMAFAAIGALWLAINAFETSGAVRHLYRPEMMNTGLIDAGRAMEAATAPGALVITMEYTQYGTNSPMLLYFSHRRGWSFDALALRATVLEYLHSSRGACYFATSDWPVLSAHRPDVVAYLSDKREIRLPGVYWHYRLFDLGCSPSGIKP